ncbi:MAG: NAD-dependent epimerase/dehydratase family protein [Chloroflexota bacterium]
MKKTILTGAAGFIGANLARRLLQEGHQLHLLLRPGDSQWRLQDILKDAQVHMLDLSEAPAVSSAVEHIRPEYIFHLAAYGAYSSQADLPRMIAANISGTANLLEACLRTGFAAFVNTGSSSEYGFKDHAPAENEWIEPNSHYAVTKAAATLYCRFTAQKHHLHIPTLRLYSVYGPYEEPTRLIPTLIVRGLQNQLPPLVNPEIQRDYVYIEDVVDAYLLAADTPHQEPGAVYNVGTGRATSLREVVEVARRILKVTAVPEWGSMLDRAWDTSIWVADNRALQKALGWQPRYDFVLGFQSTMEWLQGTSGRLQFYQSNLGRLPS